MPGTMTIGRLAGTAAVNVETIRYYQRRGLIAVPLKPPGGQRRYSEAVLRQIEFIRRAQNLGFTLEEITRLQRISDGRNCARGRDIAQVKLEELAARVAELNRLCRELRRLVRRCDARKANEPCPFIRALNGDSS